MPLPRYLPARMLNDYVYCPRLFFYEWVEGVFAHSADTVEGALALGVIPFNANSTAPTTGSGRARGDEDPGAI